MRPGLSQDDIYIMVEDEFLSTTRLYTQHLHHAEYVRLKRLAETRRPTLDPIERPVDSITKMREETKRRKESEKHAAKTNGALNSMMGGVQARQPQGEGTDSDDGEGEERMDAPGVGTALGHLMKTSPRSNFGGLGGLHGVKSSTRAAAGFGKMGSQSQEKERLDLKPFSKPVASVGKVSVVEEDETSDDDDLDVPVVRRLKASISRQQQPKAADHNNPINRPPPKPPAPSSSRHSTVNGHSANGVATSAPKTRLKVPGPSPVVPPPPESKLLQQARRPLSLPDDDLVQSSSAQTDAIRRRIQARRERERNERQEKQEKIGKPMDLDEIPTFLV